MKLFSLIIQSLTSLLIGLVLGVWGALETLAQHFLGASFVPVKYANDISSDLQIDLILDSAMEAFKETLMPLAMISYKFDDLRLKGTNKVQVPYFPLQTAASRDFNGQYIMDGSSMLSKELTIDRRKYQSLSFTSEEWNRQPSFDPERLGRLKGQQLAADVLADVFGLVTLANFGAAIYDGPAADFSVDDVIDIEAAVITAKWPALMRGMILNTAFMAGIKKDMNANGGLATFGRDSNGAATTFPSLNSFSFAFSNVIPTNGEDLGGVVLHPSALLFASSPITPAPAVMDKLTDYRVQPDDDLGIALEYREWGDADTDTEKRTIEINYGRAVGEAAALKRITT